MNAIIDECNNWWMQWLMNAMINECNEWWMQWLMNAMSDECNLLVELYGLDWQTQSCRFLGPL